MNKIVMNQKELEEILDNYDYKKSLFISELRKLNEKIGNIPILDLYEETQNIRGITSGMSEMERFSKYLEIKNIPSEDRSEYLSVGIDITNYDEGCK